jgi:hypothetical protein
MLARCGATSLLKTIRSSRVICKCNTWVCLKGTLGVKLTTTNWAVLRECGHEPLQFYWFRSIVKLYNSMLKSNSETLSRLLKADLSIHSRDPSSWTAFGLRCFSRVAALQFIFASSVAGYFHFCSRIYWWSEAQIADSVERCWGI